MKDPDDFETKDMSELEWEEFIGATAKVFTTKDKMYVVSDLSGKRLKNKIKRLKGDKDE